MAKYLIFEAHGGAGKNVIATQVVTQLKIRHPDHLIVIVTGHEGVWIHNPDIHRAYSYHNLAYFYEDFVSEETIFYTQEVYKSNGYLRGEPLAKAWNEMYGLDPIGGDPHIHLTQKETLFQKQRPFLLLQPFGGGNENRIGWYRDMPIELANNIAAHFAKKYQIIQVKLPAQPTIQGCEIFSTENARELIGMILHADKIVCIDSFVQHAAAALGKKAVVLFPTERQKTIFGHKIHKNIVGNEKYESLCNKYSVFEQFNIGGMPVEYPHLNDNEIYDFKKIIKEV